MLLGGVDVRTRVCVCVCVFLVGSRRLSFIALLLFGGFVFAKRGN